jgi:RNA polymerase sigma factor (sigma-70 family)
MSIEDAYDRYADDLVRYATVLVSRSAAADVVADTFADLLRKSDGAWSKARDPRAFLFGAVANHARMHHRQTARRREREQQLVMARRRPAETVVDDPPHSLLEAFGELSVQQRAVTYLTYWHDLSVAQVAATLGVSDGAVRRQLARARDRLRGAL